MATLAQLITNITQVTGEFGKPSDSTAQGTLDLLSRRYGFGQRTGVYADLQSTVAGFPINMGGSKSGIVQPKAYIGAENITIMNTINTTTIPSKIGSDLTVRGGATIANSTAEIFNDDAYQFGGGTNNYIFNKGDVESGTPNNPKTGDCVLIDAVGKDVVVTGSESLYPLGGRWGELISVLPQDLATGGWFASKGFNAVATVQVGIYSNGTNVYRVIGGTQKLIDTVANILLTTQEITFEIQYDGTGTPWDSMYVNGVAKWTETTDSIGVYTSALTMVIGGLRSTDSEGSATTVNHDGYYRRHAIYNKDVIIQERLRSIFAKSHYGNYTSSMLIIFPGDSNANGAGVTSRDKTSCFLDEAWLQGLGLDVLCGNNGVNGLQLSQMIPLEIAQPNYWNYGEVDEDEEVFSTNTGASITTLMENWLPDAIVTSAGSNAYANQSENNAPYDWIVQGHAEQLISSYCSKYDIPLIVDGAGVHTLPNTDFERDISRKVSEYLNQIGGDRVDTNFLFEDPTTRLGYASLLNDDVHYNDDGQYVKHLNERNALLSLVIQSKTLYP
jgi:hypothetical protein